jgi:hypothetical protein
VFRSDWVLILLWPSGTKSSKVPDNDENWSTVTHKDHMVQELEIRGSPVAESLAFRRMVLWARCHRAEVGVQKSQNA